MADENHLHPDANTPTGSTAGVPLSTPKVEPASSVPDKKNPEALRDDIAKILSAAKLPERRSGGLALDKKNVIEVKSFDTALSAGARADIAKQKQIESQTSHIPEPPKEKGEDGTVSSVTPLHTFKQDLQHVVRDKKISVVRAASLEQEKRRPGPIDDNFPPPRKKSGYGAIIIVGCILFVLGLAAIFGVYLVMSQSTTTPIAQPSSSIVFAEQTLGYAVDGKSPTAIKSDLALARNGGSASLGSITRIVPTQSGTLDASGKPVATPITLSQFFQAIGATPPDGLLRALGDNFFFGIHTVDKNAPVLVIPVTSYDQAFAGMLAWEKTMNADLSPIFMQVPALIVDSNGIPTVRTFTDDVMHNYDVRELRDNAGAIELYYSFPSRDILIIAESPYTFPEILSRLQAGRRL